MSAELRIRRPTHDCLPDAVDAAVRGRATIGREPNERGAVALPSADEVWDVGLNTHKERVLLRRVQGSGEVRDFQVDRVDRDNLEPRHGSIIMGRHDG